MQQQPGPCSGSSCLPSTHSQPQQQQMQSSQVGWDTHATTPHTCCAQDVAHDMLAVAVCCNRMHSMPALQHVHVSCLKLYQQQTPNTLVPCTPLCPCGLLSGICSTQAPAYTCATAGSKSGAECDCLLWCVPCTDTTPVQDGSRTHLLGLTPQDLKQQCMPSKKAAQASVPASRRQHRPCQRPTTGSDCMLSSCCPCWQPCRPVVRSSH
jgi:hypothetical protein